MHRSRSRSWANITLPKDKPAEDFTLEDALPLLEGAAAKGKGGKKKAAPKKKAAAKKK